MEKVRSKLRSQIETFCSGSSGIVGTVFQPMPSSRRNGGVPIISADENKRKQEERVAQLMAQKKEVEEKFQSLKKGDVNIKWPSTEQLQKEVNYPINMLADPSMREPGRLVLMACLITVLWAKTT